ncbi:MAG: transposase [Flavobacteriales bacterium]
MWHDTKYGDVAQEWLLVRSEQARKREGHNLNKRMLKQYDQGQFKKLGQQAFSCQEDAKNALVHREAKQTFLVVDSQINKVLVNLGAGRPS